MGGPSDLKGVKPFLTAILEDPFILGMPTVLRYPLSRLIVRIRLKKVIERYRLIGGGSPLAKWSEIIVQALRKEFKSETNDYIRIEYAFRYCSPTIPEVLSSFKDDGFDDVIIFPLFPHYTRAMTGSISALAKDECKKLNVHLIEIPVWGSDIELLNIQRDYLHQALKNAGVGARVLFVAHGIPISDVRRGDRYPQQVEHTAHKLGASLPEGVEWSLAYSSRLGPVKWLGPYLEDELSRLGETPEPIVIMQVSFVFDCLETLYDLDIVAIDSLKQMGVSKVTRVPSFNDNPLFVKFIYKLLSAVRSA